MLRFCANLSLLFTEYPWPDRFAAAKRAGFNAVEIQFPYDLPANEIKHYLDTCGLQLILFNVPAATLLQGGEGLAAVPESVAQFQSAIAQALEYGRILQPVAINVLPGRCADETRRSAYLQTLSRNLYYAADAFAQIGVKTVFEAINSYDMPSFLLQTGQQMLAMLSEVKHANLYMQYDIYHMSRMEEDCADFLRRHLDKIAHIQVADCPGRGQPGSGRIDFPGLFDLIEQSAYPGWIGAEYRPGTITEASLGWLKS